jgi:hypothetical protein
VSNVGAAHRPHQRHRLATTWCRCAALSSGARSVRGPLRNAAVVDPAVRIKNDVAGAFAGTSIRVGTPAPITTMCGPEMVRDRHRSRPPFSRSSVCEREPFMPRHVQGDSGQSAQRRPDMPTPVRQPGIARACCSVVLAKVILLATPSEPGGPAEFDPAADDEYRCRVTDQIGGAAS